MPAAATDAKQLFLQNLASITRLAAAVARRHGLSAADAEDFESEVRLKLIENDYALLRKFQGRSSLMTYLAVVVANLFRDYRIRNWGKWRSSAEARRLGPVAERLEELIYRDGYTVTEAVDRVRATLAPQHTSRQLVGLALRLPSRVRARPTECAAPEDLPAASRADELLASQAEEWQEACDALAGALGTLPEEDRLVVRLRYWEGLSVADVSRVMHLEQKPLYRRLEGNLKRLRTALEAAGLDAGRVSELLDGGAP